MSNLVNLHHREKIREEASVWVVKMKEGLTVEQEQELDAWLGIHPDCSSVLVEISTAWDELDLIEQLSQPSATIRKLPKTDSPTNKTLAIAASLVVCVSLGWLGYKSEIQNEPAKEVQLVNFSPDVYETSIGEQSKVTFPDRSIASLNTDSKISVLFSNTERKVILHRGEAHFDVEPDKKRPFSVLAGSNTIRAIGTSFNVFLQDNNELEVVVTEGKVAVFSTPKSPSIHLTQEDQIDVELSVGENLEFDGKTETVTKISKKKLEDRIAWTSGMMIFDDRPLDEVIAELNRYTDTRIIIGDPSLTEIKVGGYFKAGDVDALLLALSKNFSIMWHEEEKGLIVLSAR